MTDTKFIKEYIEAGGSYSEACGVIRIFGAEIEREFYLALALWAIRFSTQQGQSSRPDKTGG